jgi:hypothetical protein
MLKKVLLSTAIATSIFATQIELQPGWNLVENGQNAPIEKFSNNECVRSVFKYTSENWSLYHTNTRILNTNLRILKTLPKQQGLWVYNETYSTCYVEFSQENESNDLSNYESAESLSVTQKEDLQYMYQEEKVARDVYLTLYNKYNSQVFYNISQAEQKHMDSVKTLLENYNIEVPVLSDEIGKFDLVELQELYDTLIESGSVSEYEAFKVGELVELTDIADLEEKIVNTPEDIEAIYQNLLDGSYKHLEAFRKKL